MKASKSVLHFVGLVLVLVGAINWGLIGLFNLDLVKWLCGPERQWLIRFVYILVGVAGVWELGLLKRINKLCGCSSGTCEKGCNHTKSL